MQGDGLSMKGFFHDENLLGNAHIPPKAVQLFHRLKNEGKNIKKTKIFNLYCGIDSIKSVFFNYLVNLLIRRNIFT